MKTLKKSILLFIILEIILTGLTVYGDLKGKTICVSGTGCNEVQNSAYGEIAGIKLSILGLAAFIFLLLIYLMTYYYERGHHWVLISTIIGMCSAIYFIYLQFFVLKKLCSSCMAVDMLMIIICLYAIYDFINHKKIVFKY